MSNQSTSEKFNPIPIPGLMVREYTKVEDDRIVAIMDIKPRDKKALFELSQEINRSVSAMEQRYYSKLRNTPASTALTSQAYNTNRTQHTDAPSPIPKLKDTLLKENETLKQRLLELEQTIVLLEQKQVNREENAIIKYLKVKQLCCLTMRL